MSASGGDDPLLGKVLLGKLRVDARIGAGAMGAVYRVQHLVTNHARALKVLHESVAMDDQALVRFLREAGVSGVLKSPYVVETVDAGRLEDGSVYVLMELLEGRSLADVFDEGPMEPARLAGLLEQACRGLRAAHDAGIVHRDLKPENLFVARDESGGERIKILDFGIAKFRAAPDLAASMTEAGVLIGTPYYMAPEQMGSSKAVDARVDVWSLGVILYEGLAAQRPFDAATFARLVVKVCAEEPTPLETLRPGLPKLALDIVARAMARDADARYGTVEELRSDLSRLGAMDATPARPIDPLARTAPSLAAPREAASVERAPPVRRIGPWLAAGVAVVAVGAVVLALAGSGDADGPGPSPASNDELDAGSFDAGGRSDAGRPRDAARDAWVVPGLDASPLPPLPGVGMRSAMGAPPRGMTDGMSSGLASPDEVLGMDDG